MKVMPQIDGSSENSKAGIFLLRLKGRLCRLRIIHASEELHSRDSSANPGYSEVGHRHDVFHIILTCSSETQCVHNGKRHTPQAGELLLCPPQVLHEYRPVAIGRIHYFQVTFVLLDSRGRHVVAGFDELLIALGIAPEVCSENRIVFSPQVKAQMVEAFRNLLTAIGRGGGLFPCEAALAQIFSLIASADVNETLSEGRIDKDGIARAFRYMKEHYRQPIDISQLASVSGYSEGYFLRVFKQRYKVSPLACLNGIRIAVAKNLLLAADRRISEIAADVGFHDPYYFSRRFRQSEGCSPRAFRLKQVIGAGDDV